MEKTCEKWTTKHFSLENVLLSFVFLLVESVIILACTISSIAHVSSAFCVRLNLLFLVWHLEAIFTWMQVKSISCDSSHGIPTPVCQGKVLCLSWPVHNPKPWPQGLSCWVLYYMTGIKWHTANKEKIMVITCSVAEDTTVIFVHHLVRPGQ